MDSLGCSGRETDISTCSFSGWGNTQCTHAQDVGIACQQGSMLIESFFFFLDKCDIKATIIQVMDCQHTCN